MLYTRFAFIGMPKSGKNETVNAVIGVDLFKTEDLLLPVFLKKSSGPFIVNFSCPEKVKARINQALNCQIKEIYTNVVELREILYNISDCLGAIFAADLPKCRILISGDFPKMTDNCVYLNNKIISADNAITNVDATFFIVNNKTGISDSYLKFIKNNSKPHIIAECMGTGINDIFETISSTKHIADVVGFTDVDTCIDIGLDESYKSHRKIKREIKNEIKNKKIAKWKNIKLTELSARTILGKQLDELVNDDHISNGVAYDLLEKKIGDQFIKFDNFAEGVTYYNSVKMHGKYKGKYRRLYKTYNIIVNICMGYYVHRFYNSLSYRLEKYKIISGETGISKYIARRSRIYYKLYVDYPFIINLINANKHYGIVGRMGIRTFKQVLAKKSKETREKLKTIKLPRWITKHLPV